LPTKTTEEQAAINLLTGWNFVIDKDSAAPTVFMAWAEAFRDATFGDEFGSAGIPLSGDQGRMPSFAVLESLVRTNSSSHWFDNISTTTKVETMNDTIQAAFDQAMSALGTYFGNTNVATWTWGNVNQVYFEHLTGFSAFSEGPYPANGTDETITPAWGSIWQDGKVVQNIATGGSSEREILDFSDLNNSLSVIPSGERGVSSSRHYDDQLQMFLNGQYHVSYFSANTPAKFLASWVESSILFKPAGGA
ncbi:MAG TPA: penicillin acylase family protein, partial [Candidatus Lokiarchaeia archaeon]|nr:penicillin acylase family protein [Candidatus Lokiarchaeia archaeon]